MTCVFLVATNGEVKPEAADVAEEEEEGDEDQWEQVGPKNKSVVTRAVCWQFSNDLAQDYSNSSALALDLLLSCTKPSIYANGLKSRNVTPVFSNGVKSCFHQCSVHDKSVSPVSV